MSAGAARQDGGGGSPPSPTPPVAATDRLRAAIDGLDEAARAEGIAPDGPLGAWVAAQKDVLNALYAVEEHREEQVRALLENAKATAEAQLARAQAEAGKLDRFIAKAELQLAQAQNETIVAVGKGIAAHVQGALVIREKAYNRTRYLGTALAYGVVLLCTLLGGYAWSSHAHGTSIEAHLWERCKQTVTADKQGRFYCAPTTYVEGR